MPKSFAMTLVDKITFAFVLLLGWWLSGYDSELMGVSRITDFMRRIARCVATFILVWVFIEFLSESTVSEAAYLPKFFLIALTIGITWAGCLAGLFAHIFCSLIEPHDRRALDADKSLRDLDTIASLIRNGRKEEAIQLCQMLKKSGDANVLAIEAQLAQLGVRQTNVEKPKPLAVAYGLCLQRRFRDAIAVLNPLLEKEPSNLDAALMLMRIYAENLHRRDKAMKILRLVEQQSRIPASRIEHARRSIERWSVRDTDSGKLVLQPKPEAVDDLVANGYLGTAIEILEQAVKGQPRDFDSWMKLAEVQGLHCGNLRKAEKIIQQLEANPVFSPEQIRLLRVKLEEWRNARGRHIS